MTDTWRVRSIAMIAFGWLVFAAPLPVAGADASTETVKVELFAAAKPTTFYPLLPVFLKYRITNESDKQTGAMAPPYLRISMHESYPFSIFVGEGETGPLERRYPRTFFWARDDPSKKHYMLVDPHASKTFDLLLGFEPTVVVPDRAVTSKFRSKETTNKAEYAIFWKPGVYRVKIVIGTRHVFESNELVVRIAEPRGQNLGAYNALLRSEYPYLFCHPGVSWRHTGSFRKQIEELLEAYPESDYSRYAKFLMARSMCVVRDLTKDGTLPPGPIEGLQILNALSEDPDFPCADLALYELGAKGSGVRSDSIRAIMQKIRREEGEKAYQALQGRTSKAYRAILAIPQVRLAVEFRDGALIRMKGRLPPEKLESLKDDSDVFNAYKKMLFYKYYHDVAIAVGPEHYP